MLRDIYQSASIGHVTETASSWAGRLYEAIGQAGFSVAGFARRMGVHRTTLWRIERGQLTPSQEFTEQAEALLALPTKEAAAA